MLRNGLVALGREGDAQRFRQALHAELGHQIGAMDFDRSRADAEVISDRLVRQPVRQESGRLQFGGEGGERERVSERTETADDAQRREGNE